MASATVLNVNEQSPQHSAYVTNQMQFQPQRANDGTYTQEPNQSLFQLPSPMQTSQPQTPKYI